MPKSKLKKSAAKSSSKPSAKLTAKPAEAEARSKHAARHPLHSKGGNHAPPSPADGQNDTEVSGATYKDAPPAQLGAPTVAGPGVPLAAGENRPFDLQEKIKELVRLAQEQGYLTYNDINDALPDSIVTPEELDEIYIKLRNLDVEIVDQAEVDRVKQPEAEEEDDKARLDILDDPVRMYLKQMGQVPLLTREQEVEISKRIEDAENEVKRIIYSFGFAGKEHIALAEKLISEPPKERFDRVILDKKVESRDSHLRSLRKLVKDVRGIDQSVDDRYATWQDEPAKVKRDRLQGEFKKLDAKLQNTFVRFYYKQKVIEEMALVADNIHDKIQTSLRTIVELEEQRKSPQQQQIINRSSARSRPWKSLCG